jgi:hypothetical protein
MASFLGSLGAALFGKPTPVVAKPPASPPPRVKSPERLANEKLILDTRRKILADLARAEERTGEKIPVQELIQKILAGQTKK